MKKTLLCACVALGSLLFASCINEYGADMEAADTRATTITFDLVVPLSSVVAPDGYENGNIYENTIDIARGDYRVYFYDSDNTFITNLEETTITSTDTDLNTTYTITGEVALELKNYSSFKVVMLANWGTYTEPTANSTIDDLCNAEAATFNANTYFANSETTYIPFYGVHEYTDVTLATDGTMNYLQGTLTLLRALAKVEVILTNASDDVYFDDVSIVHYNSQGYCAPGGVYSQKDYGQPTTWATDYVSTLHLLNGVNDSENSSSMTTRTVDFNEDTDATYQTWTIYLPEYDNSGTDYSYILIKTQDGEEHTVYFAQYVDGVTDAYDDNGDESARWNIRRNNLYRFYVTFNQREDNITVTVTKWNEKTGSFIVIPSSDRVSE